MMTVQGFDSDVILFNDKATFYEKNLSESVHISDDSTFVKSPGNFDANSPLNSGNIVPEGTSTVEKNKCC